jgi:hypothetical protein
MRKRNLPVLRGESMTYKKKLIEVALPLEALEQEANRWARSERIRAYVREVETREEKRGRVLQNRTGFATVPTKKYDV